VGHGTHIAGTIAAVGDNGIGIIGVAPRAKVLAVKALDRSGQGSSADGAAAIVYAAENGAQVINLSWTGPPSDTIRMAIDYVTETFDVVVVASAGNGAAPLERGYFPANLPNVLAVGATTHTDETAPFSNFGGPLDLVAPGGGDADPANTVEPQRSILSLWAKDSDLGTSCREECRCRSPECCADPECDGQVCQIVCSPAAWVVGEQYVRLGGTSQAAPHVAGVAALVRRRRPEFTQQQVRQVLRSTADDLGPSAWDEQFGYGRVTAQQAVKVDDIPVAEILVPENRGKVWERNFPLNVIGTAQPSAAGLAQWRLTARPLAGGAPAEVASGTNAIVNGPLGTLELGGRLALQPGQRYVLDLEATDTAGHVARDSKIFLIPNPQFAAVPLPDPYDEGGADPSLSADGQQVAFGRIDRDTPNSVSTWLLDVALRRLERIPNAQDGRLSPDGKFLFYREAVGLPYRSVLRSLADSASVTLALQDLPLNTYWFSLSNEGARLAFLAGGQFEPELANADRSFELFLFDTPEGPVRQVTHGPRGNPGLGLEIQDLVMTPDGQSYAFSAQTDLDPTATTGGNYQVFIYDDRARTVRQLTGRSTVESGGSRPAISSDGSTAAYESNGIFLANLPSGAIEQVVDGTGGPLVPLLSADARTLAFSAWLDLDPAVGNEDLSPEIFIMDIQTRAIRQVTDSVNFPYVRYGTVMDAMGNTFLTAPGELNGLALHPGISRFVRRRSGNRAPILEPLSTIMVSEGKISHTALRARDEEGDAITFHVERYPFGDPHKGRLNGLARSVLQDHRDGTADLELAPYYCTAGRYGLRIAAFDDAGEVGIQEAALEIEQSLHQPDVNVDGRVDSSDLALLIESLFGRHPYPSVACDPSDLNNDALLSAADLVAWCTR
jgi:hypothetical protein